MLVFKAFVFGTTILPTFMYTMAVPLQLLKRHYSSSLPISFDNYNGNQALSGFDNFYGLGNFGGSSNQIVLQETSVVCEQQDIVVIQQQLAVLVEFAKMIITQEVCDVEVQTILLSQYMSGLQSFSGDLLRQTGRNVGYDHSVASKIGQLHDSNGNLQHSNLNFNGKSVGSQFVSPSGNDWNNDTSPASVGSAFGLACAAGGLS